MVIPVRKQIKEMTFCLLSPEKIKKLSVAKIVTPELYDVDGYPVDGGLMDLRLGAIDPGVRCRTCGGRLKECLGHPGLIELARPLIHIKYLPIIYLVKLIISGKLGLSHGALISLLAISIHFYAISALTGAVTWMVFGVAWGTLNEK